MTTLAGIQPAIIMHLTYIRQTYTMSIISTYTDLPENLESLLSHLKDMVPVCKMFTRDFPITAEAELLYKSFY